jgi:protein-disulfide isomerase
MKRFTLACLLVAMTLFGLPRLAMGAPRACDTLAGAQRQLAQEILQSQHAYDCCDATLAQCLQKKPVCRVVRRVAEDVCRRVAAGKSRSEIERELARRATSMIPSGTPARIDTKGSTAAGSADAKVTVVAYVCPRCPFCARLMPELERSVESGRLAGKVKLHVRLFPVRSHPGSTEAGLGLVAADRLGKFWEYLLRLYRDFDKFEAAKLADVAAAEGMDRKRFADMMVDPNTRQRLLESKKEGVRNGVEATPTFFIDGRRYTAELSLPALEDVLEEEHDRVTGKQHE